MIPTIRIEVDEARFTEVAQLTAALVSQGALLAHSRSDENEADGYGVKYETAPIHPSLLIAFAPWRSGRQHADLRLGEIGYKIGAVGRAAYERVDSPVATSGRGTWNLQL